MLEKKLEEAVRKSRRQQMILLAVVVFLMLIGAVVVLVSQLDFRALQAPAAPAVARETPLQREEAPIVRIAPSSPETETANPAHSRDEVVRLLGRFEEAFEPTLKSAPFAAWNGRAAEALFAARDKVIMDLANGDTDRAFDEASALLVEAESVTAAFDAAFAEALATAAAAYEGDDYASAHVATERALALRPGDAGAAQLAEKIAALPEILDLIEKARIARIENDLEEELTLSREIVRLDDGRNLYRERIAEIESALREQRFAGAIAAGFDALKAENIARAEAAYKQASAIYSSREETKNLAEQLQDLKRKVTFRQSVREGDAAIKADNWTAAMSHYQAAAALYPDNAEVLEAVSLIEQILRHNGEVTRFLQQPERLSAPNIRNEAERAISEASLFSAMSPSLQRNIAALETAISRQNREIDVWVLSDKLTTVSVRSVGHVGQVDRYKIRLKPGQYIFEGRREGYRTKAVPVTISPDDGQVEVTVISDERI